MMSMANNSASSTRKSLTNYPPTCALNYSMLLLVQKQQGFYEESRRKIVRGAKAYVEAGIERQQVKLPIFYTCSPWADSRNRRPQIPQNSFNAIPHFSGPRPRNEFPGRCPSGSCLQLLDPLLHTLYFLTAVIPVAYIYFLCGRS